MSKEHAWIKEFPASVMVCDPDGILLEMNDKAAKAYTKEGGYALIGKNLFDCHPERARGKLESLLDKRQANIYTIEKDNVKKMVYQSPWYRDGKYAGFVELVLEIPFEMPHFIRK
jgi:transcriptional regulator with PAS, ATPase and Fis domain